MVENFSIQRSLLRVSIPVVLNIKFYIDTHINRYYEVRVELLNRGLHPQANLLYILFFSQVQCCILICMGNKLLYNIVHKYKLKQIKRITRIYVARQICTAINIGTANRKGVEFGQRPWLRGAFFCLLMLWNNILSRLNKICIIGCTFTAHCGG